MNEETLIEQAQSGDQAAMERLLRIYDKFIHSMTWKLCPYKDLYEDVYQESRLHFIRAVNAWNKSNSSKLMTLAYMYIRNGVLNALVAWDDCWVDYRRGKNGAVRPRIRRSIYKTDHPDVEDFGNNIAEFIHYSKDKKEYEQIENHAIDNSLLPKVLNALNELPEPERVVITHRLEDSEHYTTAELGRMLGYSHSAISDMWYRGIKNIRRVLREEYNILTSRKRIYLRSKNV